MSSLASRYCDHLKRGCSFSKVFKNLYVLGIMFQDVWL